MMFAHREVCLQITIFLGMAAYDACFVRPLCFDLVNGILYVPAGVGKCNDLANVVDCPFARIRTIQVNMRVAEPDRRLHMPAP